MASQWNIGMAGRTGLRYEALPVVCPPLGIAWPLDRETFDCLRTIERVVLSEDAKRRAER